MSGTTVPVVGAEGVGRPETGERTGRRLRLRHLWVVPGLAIAIVANQLGQANGVGILALIAFGITPDMPRLLGWRGRHAHSLTHQPIAALAAVGIAATGIVPVAWLVASLVWLGHVIVGLGVGDVPRGNGRTAHA